MKYLAPAKNFWKPILVNSPLYSLPGNQDFPVMNTPVSHDSTVVNTPGGLYSPVRWGIHRGVNYEYGKLYENSTNSKSFLGMSMGPGEVV
jgi:hypothetical protein